MTTTAIPETGEATTGEMTWVSPKRAFTVMKASEMDELFFVSTYDAYDPDSHAPANHGYQRNPMDSRFPAIGRYYSAHTELVTPIIISVRLADPVDIERFGELLADGNAAAIHDEFGRAVCSIVDGQHRVGGLIDALTSSREDEDPVDLLAPAMLFFDLTYVEEAELFDTINTTQRKLPKALIEVTKGDITESGEPTHAQKIREITFALARDPDSVWYDDVNMTGARDPNRKITYEGLRRSTANMLTAELISRLETAAIDPVQIEKGYWRMVSQACSQAWNGMTRTVTDDTGRVSEDVIPFRIKELVGVASLARLGKDVITSAMELRSFEPDLEITMSDLISKLSEVDWEKRSNNPWVASQAGFAGQKELYTLLYNLVYNDVRPGNQA